MKRKPTAELLAELHAGPARSVTQLDGRWRVMENGQPVSGRQYAGSTVEALWHDGHLADTTGGPNGVLYPTGKDRRSVTSRANLGRHVPKAIDPDGTVVLSTRIGKGLAARIDEARGRESRSEWLRAYLERTVG